MKYFVINTTIRDGEYEYLHQSPVMAKTANEAQDLMEKDALEWTQDDYRMYEMGNATEISKEEFDIISKYIY